MEKDRPGRDTGDTHRRRRSWYSWYSWYLGYGYHYAPNGAPGGLVPIRKGQEDGVTTDAWVPGCMNGHCLDHYYLDR